MAANALRTILCGACIRRDRPRYQRAVVISHILNERGTRATGDCSVTWRNGDSPLRGADTRD